MLVENNHRGKVAALVYSGMLLFVPEKGFIFGMTNAEDRTLKIFNSIYFTKFNQNRICVNQTKGTMPYE